jgi:hypothetical protein
VLQWYSGGLGVVWDEKLDLHSRGELMRWMLDGQQFVILDYETGEDVTRVFLAISATHVIDPMK